MMGLYSVVIISVIVSNAVFITSAKRTNVIDTAIRTNSNVDRFKNRLMRRIMPTMIK